MPTPYVDEILLAQEQFDKFWMKYLEEERIRGNNQVMLKECEHKRQNRVDIASGILAIATYLIYDKYYDKYKEVIEWRDEIGLRIKACLEGDIDHYINIVMSQMNKAISDVLGAPTVSVEYSEIVGRYDGYSNSSSGAASELIKDIQKKTCDKNSMECDTVDQDLRGWGAMSVVSASDARTRFDEARVPRRLELLSGALDSTHSSTFRLPDLDYQALSNAANISTSLASAYAGIANSALGGAGYFSTNFVNSLS